MSTNTVVGRKTMSGGVPQIAPSGNLAFLDGNVVDTSLNTLRTLALGNPVRARLARPAGERARHLQRGRLRRPGGRPRDLRPDRRHLARHRRARHRLPLPAERHPRLGDGLQAAGLGRPVRRRKPRRARTSSTTRSSSPTPTPEGRSAASRTIAAGAATAPSGTGPSPTPSPAPAGPASSSGRTGATPGPSTRSSSSFPPTARTHDGDLSLAATASPSPVADGVSSHLHDHRPQRRDRRASPG